MLREHTWDVTPMPYVPIFVQEEDMDRKIGYAGTFGVIMAAFCLVFAGCIQDIYVPI